MILETLSWLMVIWYIGLLSFVYIAPFTAKYSVDWGYGFAKIVGLSITSFLLLAGGSIACYQF